MSACNTCFKKLVCDDYTMDDYCPAYTERDAPTPYCGPCADKDATIAKLREELAEAKAEVDKFIEARDWYKKRLDRLQRDQEHFRDPERTMLCDIIANGHLMNKPERYKVVK